MDELADIIRLAGVNEFKGYTEYTLENMSQTATLLSRKSVTTILNLATRNGLNFGLANLI